MCFCAPAALRYKSKKEAQCASFLLFDEPMRGKIELLSRSANLNWLTWLIFLQSK